MADSTGRTLLQGLGAEIIPFESKHFGETYPYRNKIEALKARPAGAPFVFFDTATLITGDPTEIPFDFTKPSASRRVDGTCPRVELYGPGYAATWRSLYDMFGLNFESSLDPAHPNEHWRRYLYFNAGFFFTTSALMCSASGSQPMPPASVMTVHPDSPVRRSIPGLTR